MALEKELLNRVHSAAVFKRRVRVLSTQLAKELDKGTVLDVGCGDGSIAKAIMAHKPSLQFRGIDVFLRPKIAIPADVYDGNRIPFRDHSFDWVTIVDVLHHTDNPQAVLGECFRIARQGVVIKDHLKEGLAAEQTLRLMDWVGNKGHDVSLPYNYLSREEWNRIFLNLAASVHSWNDDLGIYPIPVTFLFDRKLHFIATLRQ